MPQKERRVDVKNWRCAAVRLVRKRAHSPDAAISSRCDTAPLDRNPLLGCAATESSSNSTSSFYNIRTLKSGNAATLFSEVASWESKGKHAPFSSSTARLATLPNSRTIDARQVHSLDTKAHASHLSVQDKVWDGRAWVEPAMLLRR
jgi:hypothetical protein